MFEEAVLSQDTDTIRLAGLAVGRRLHELASIDRDKDQSAVRDDALRFDMEFGAWRKANPTAVERLKEIERQRGSEALQFDQSVEFALRAYGVDCEVQGPALRPTPDVEPNASSMRIGPAWDRLRDLASGDPTARR